MRALWLENGELSLREGLPAPEPPEGEALIRVTCAGICGTDLALEKGYYPYTGVPGHEFVGVVERGPENLVNRRVVGEINASCGRCPSCRAGHRTHCPTRTVLGIVNRNGAFAERLTLPVENLHSVPSSLPDEVAVFTEPLAAALRIQEQVEIEPGMRVLVVGDGRLGQLVARILSLTPCDLSVSGRHDTKLDILARAGIRTLMPEAITENAFDLAVECTGNAGGFAAALGAVRPRGTIVMKSTYASALSFRADAVVVNEIRLIGSRCGPFEPALRKLAAGEVDVLPLIQARFPIQDGIAAFEKARRPGILKVLIEFDT
jgi:threonine dehydrogenase-like Zn-dependent dehydrogenase